MKNMILRVMILAIASLSFGCSGNDANNKPTAKMEAPKDVTKRPK